MRKLTDVQIIELFHVAFLDVLPKRVDRRRYILKGGVGPLPLLLRRAPFEQKVAALAERPETQARDVFDLDLLLRLRPRSVESVEAGLLSRAAAIALELPYEAFRDQVLPFLEEDARELYEGEEAWQAMQLFVAETLEGAR